MTPTKSVLGLLCLSALYLAAFGAANASASTIHECKEAVGTGTSYTSSTCETAGSGPFQTVPLPLNEFKSVKATQTSNFTLSETVGGVVLTITCTGPETLAQEAENLEGGGGMTVFGVTGTSRFTGCSVTTPKEKGCAVPSTLETVKLKSTTTLIGNTRIEPVSGTTFITIPVTKCSSEALNGNKAVTGSATSARETSATQAFTSSSGSSLVFGGQTATFTGKYHMSTPTGQILGIETP